MELKQDINTYIRIRKSDGKVDQKFIFVYAKSGYGKSLAVESLIEEYHRAGFTVLILSDVKDEWESAYAMFKPKEKYHLDQLNYIGKEPRAKKVKLYHPFTFRMPKTTPLPPIKWYGFSLKEMGRAEWSMISESVQETDTIRVLLNASSSINKSDGLFSFLHNVEAGILGRSAAKKDTKPDPKLFHLRIKSATAKSLQDIASYLLPFKTDYLLLPDNSPLLLNWRDILNDHEPYHFFVSPWIKDKKIKNFLVLALLEAIIRNNKYCRKPVLIVIPEIRFLTPQEKEGYTRFLARGIKEKLSVMRSQGRGFSAIFDSQVWGDVDVEVRDSATETFFGEIGGEKDLERICKALQFKRNVREKLNNMGGKNKYLWKGKESMEEFTMWMPGHMHAEESYNFLAMFKKLRKNERQPYTKLYEQMREQMTKEKTRIKERIKKRIQAADNAKKPGVKKQLAEERERMREKFVQEKAKILGKIESERETKMKLVYQVWLDNPGVSFSELARRTDCSKNTAKKYVTMMEEREKNERDLELESEALQNVELEI